MTDSQPRSFVSSRRADVWHDLREPTSSEVWCYCALSDDGKELVLIKFHDNYRASPKFYANGDKFRRTPAVEFTYLNNGRVQARSFCEFKCEDLVASPDDVELSILGNYISGKDAEYGKGHVVEIDLPASHSRRLRATMEWLSIETDLADTEPLSGSNIVTPRADVSGKISILKGKVENAISFRGTGTHSHRIITSESNEISLNGCVHFSDATAIIESIDENTIILTTITNGNVVSRDLVMQTKTDGLNTYGLSYPRKVKFVNGTVKLELSRRTMITSMPFGSAFLSDVTLRIDNAREKHSIGVFEYNDHSRMNQTFWRKLSGMRIRKDDSRI